MSLCICRSCVRQGVCRVWTHVKWDDLMCAGMTHGWKPWRWMNVPQSSTVTLAVWTNRFRRYCLALFAFVLITEMHVYTHCSLPMSHGQTMTHFQSIKQKKLTHKKRTTNGVSNLSYLYIVCNGHCVIVNYAD